MATQTNSQSTPARIVYKTPDGQNQVIRFHSVIMEGHEASSEITKFPVQTGFVVSNHAIRKNRKVVIEALFTNWVLANSVAITDGTGEENKFDLNTGVNNSRAAFDACKALVNSAVSCDVVTNLGLYKGVVFTNFKTKTEAGMTDCIKVTLVGEEVQTQDRDNRTAPILIKFIPVPTSARQSVIDELTKQGVPVPEGAPLSQAFGVDLAKSFAVSTVSAIGKATTNTYEILSKDGVSGASSMKVFEGLGEFGGKVYDAGEKTFFEIGSLVGDRLKGAVGATSACMVDGLIDAAIDGGEEIVDSVSGKLRKGTYGLVSKITGVNAGETGALLPGLAKECIVVGAKSIVSNTGVEPSLPTAATVAAGFRRQSSGLTVDKYTFTKIGDAINTGKGT